MSPVLERVTVESGEALLAFLVDHDTVRPMADRDALDQRLRPDRTGFVVLDRARSSEPLSFVWVALTDTFPTSVDALLGSGRPVVDVADARMAIFYSVHNVRPDLRSGDGASWAKHVLRGAFQELHAGLPALRTFATLSPIPGYRVWEQGAPSSQGVLRYLHTTGDDGRPIDPVARFHLGNGARIERILSHADPSPRGLERSFGWMVSYRYPD